MGRHDVVLKKYVREELCSCKKPHKKHKGFVWQEGSGSDHYPTRVVEEVTIDNGNPNRLRHSQPYL